MQDFESDPYNPPAKMHILCAVCLETVVIPDWPEHAAGHKGLFCLSASPINPIIPCRRLKGHKGEHASCRGYMKWAQSSKLFTPQPDSNESPHTERQD